MDLFGPVEPWIAILDAFGIAVVVVAWHLLRTASERTRGIVAAFAAVLLASALLRALGAVTAFAATVNVIDADADGGGSRRVLAVLLLVAGVAAGVAAVLTLHRRADEAADDLAADAADAAALGPDEADAEPDGYTLSRQRLVALKPWVDVLALAVAVALPIVGRGFLGFYGGPPGRDVTVGAALYHVVTGIAVAAPLLVLLRRPDVGTRVVAAAAAVIAAGALVLPVWPEALANEFWVALASGLAAGLMAAVALRLLAEGLPDDRSVGVIGVLAAMVFLALTAWLAAQIAQGWAELPADVENELDEGFVPPIPSELLPTELPAVP